MNTVKLGGTDLEISEIGFGGIPIIPLPKNEAVSIVKYCFDCEEKCPYNLPITDLLKENLALYKEYV